jgi:methylene-tetrahydromethanopterin dehydrogenase
MSNDPSSPYLLHAFTPLRHISPFDVNMAHDAGFDAVIPYAGITVDEIPALVQDVIFSRSPENGARTGIFLGGRDAFVALDMLAEARQAMLPPFEVSVFADPSGAFTTAAAMVAVVDRHLHATGGISGKRVAIFGAKGIVGGIAGVIAAQAGAQVTLVGHDGIANVQRRADDFRGRFKVDCQPVDGSTEAARVAILKTADVALCAARAGVRVLTLDNLGAAAGLKVVADVNAVPPSGCEGLELTNGGDPIAGTDIAGIGALAIGNVKFQVQHQLLQAMRSSPQRLYLDHADAFRIAQKILGD